MRQSTLFTKTIKEKPRDEKSINAIFLERAGFIHKEMAGAYSILPLGLKVIRNIESLIRKEMKQLFAQEVSMTVLQPKEIWEKTGRWSGKLGQEVMYKTKQGRSEVGLGPTHEEMLTNIIKRYVHSFENLPLYVYQIQTKFRKEPRARSGILRGREFGMKDLYSFDRSFADFKKYYQKVKGSYLKIFEGCGLEAIITEASGAGFTKDYTHEFQVIAESGEDEIIYCPNHHFSQNKEVAKLKEGDDCPVCGEKLKKANSIEVGNIFPLGTTYSKAMKAFFKDKDGKEKPIIMGCYGIGTSRLMGTIVEVHHDEKGIIWPSRIAPFQIHFLALSSDKGRVKKAAERTYQDLKKSGMEILYDDREGKSAGEKFADADLIGIPWRLVISEKTLAQDSIEIKKRGKEKKDLIKIEQVITYLKEKIIDKER
jgi:prolyl-tRNA synthetase